MANENKEEKKPEEKPQGVLKTRALSTSSPEFQEFSRKYMKAVKKAEAEFPRPKPRTPGRRYNAQTTGGK